MGLNTELGRTKKGKYSLEINPNCDAVKDGRVNLLPNGKIDPKSPAVLDGSVKLHTTTRSTHPKHEPGDINKKDSALWHVREIETAETNACHILSFEILDAIVKILGLTLTAEEVKLMIPLVVNSAENLPEKPRDKNMSGSKSQPGLGDRALDNEIISNLPPGGLGCLTEEAAKRARQQVEMIKKLPIPKSKRRQMLRLYSKLEDEVGNWICDESKGTDEDFLPDEDSSSDDGRDEYGNYGEDYDTPENNEKRKKALLEAKRRRKEKNEEQRLRNIRRKEKALRKVWKAEKAKARKAKAEYKELARDALKDGKELKETTGVDMADLGRRVARMNLACETTDREAAIATRHQRAIDYIARIAREEKEREEKEQRDAERRKEQQTERREEQRAVQRAPLRAQDLYSGHSVPAYDPSYSDAGFVTVHASNEASEEFLPMRDTGKVLCQTFLSQNGGPVGKDTPVEHPLTKIGGDLYDK